MVNHKGFESYLMRFFTAYDWLYPIQSKLGWTKMRLGKYAAYPESMPFERVVQLAEFLETTNCVGINVDTMYLVLTRKWKCGENTITKNQDGKYVK